MKQGRTRSPEAIEFARDQRATANEFARTVWHWVESRQVYHQKFRREYPIPPYTADFCCVEPKLILENDGEGHFTEAGKERNRVRDEALAREGHRVVRISGFDVVRGPERVCQTIEERVRERMRELRVD